MFHLVKPGQVILQGKLKYDLEKKMKLEAIDTDMIRPVSWQLSDSFPKEAYALLPF